MAFALSWEDLIENIRPPSFYNEIGKNGIQYKNFNWKVIYSNNFELYFNDGSENIANIALDHIEENFSKLSSNVGHQPFKKTKIFMPVNFCLHFLEQIKY